LTDSQGWNNKLVQEQGLMLLYELSRRQQPCYLKSSRTQYRTHGVVVVRIFVAPIQAGKKTKMIVLARLDDLIPAVKG